MVNLINLQVLSVQDQYKSLFSSCLKFFLLLLSGIRKHQVQNRRMLSILQQLSAPLLPCQSMPSQAHIRHKKTSKTLTSTSKKTNLTL